MDKLIILLSLLAILGCQKKTKNNMIENSYNIQISHPENKYRVEFVSDKIITLEGISSSLPYGDSSGEWGNSGAYFTEQNGTPIGVDIVYFSPYEDTFYHLKASFPIDKMKDLVQRAYANSESDSDKPLKEYINRIEEPNYENIYNQTSVSYERMSDLVFGFAPKGMVVVWVGYSGVQIEVGRYQAEIIKADKDLEKKLFASWSMNRKEVKDDSFIINADPSLWDHYRKKYWWKPEITSTNPKLKLQQLYLHYYNGEYEILLRPWILNPEMRRRAIPKSMIFYWETSKNEGFQGEAYFDWKDTNEIFKKTGENVALNIKLAPNNNSFEVLIDGELLKTDSIRVFTNETKYKESYK